MPGYIPKFEDTVDIPQSNQANIPKFEDTEPIEPSYGKKVLNDISNIAQSPNEIAVKPFVNAYKATVGQDWTGITPGQAISAIPQATMSAIKEVPEALKQNIKGMAQPYLHPIQSAEQAPISTALAYLPVFGGISKIAGLATPEMIPAAEAEARIAAGENLGSTAGKIAGKKLTPSTITNLADPKVLSQVSADMGEDAAQLNLKGVQSLENTYNGIKSAKKQIYANNGLTDDKLIDVSNNLKDLRNNTADYSNKVNKVGDKPGIKLSNDVNDTVNNFSKLLEQNDGKMSYGDLQYFKQHFQDLADSNLNQTPGGMVGTNESRFLNKLSSSLKDSELSDPLIKKVHSQYADLSDAQDTLGTTFRLAKEGTGEVTAEKAGIRGSRDLGNLIRKQELDNIEKTLSKYDETKGLQGFSTPVKVAQEAINLQRATPVGGAVTAFQGIKNIAGTVNPLSDKFLGQGGQKINTIANLVKSGVIPPENLSSYYNRSSLTGIGEPINRLKAYSNLLDLKNRFNTVGNTLLPGAELLDKPKIQDFLKGEEGYLKMPGKTSIDSNGNIVKSGEINKPYELKNHFEKIKNNKEPEAIETGGEKLAKTLGGEAKPVGEATGTMELKKLYHVTSSDIAPSIQKDGFKPNIGERSLGSTKGVGVFLYENPDAVSEFGNNFKRIGKTPQTIETNVTGKIYDAVDNDKSIMALAEDGELINKLKKQGYVGIRGDEMGEPVHFIFDEKAIKPIAPEAIEEKK